MVKCAQNLKRERVFIGASGDRRARRSGRPTPGPPPSHRLARATAARMANAKRGGLVNLHSHTTNTR